MYKDLPLEIREKTSEEIWNNHRELLEFINAGIEKHADEVFINSWCLYEYESYAMWRVCASKGIAIQSTYKNLANSFSTCTDDIYTGVVKYLDYKKTPIPVKGNMLTPFIYKAHAFEYEKELRCLMFSFEEKRESMSANIDLKNLIEAIYVAPATEKWIYDLIKSMLKRYGLQNIECYKSDI